ncbi:MAG: DUF167 domain-containing protein [Planctomycetes bacterium]|nr:DUF167 domain-containing protein [Planctomycetota bacterium]
MIKVKVITNAKKNEIKLENGVYRVRLKSPPVDNKANYELTGLIADFFQVRKSQVRIIKGLKLKEKTLSIE